MTTAKFMGSTSQFEFVVHTYTDNMRIKTCFAFQSKSFDYKGILKPNELIRQGEMSYDAIIDLCCQICAVKEVKDEN